MDKYLKKVILFFILNSLLACNNSNINSEQKVLKDNTNIKDTSTLKNVNVDSLPSLSKEEIDSVIHLFNSIPYIEIKSPFSGARETLSRPTRLVFDNNSWKALYGEELFEDGPDSYEGVEIDLKKRIIRFVFSMDLREFHFFDYKSKLFALVKVQVGVTGMPHDHLFIYEIDKDLKWKDVTDKLLNKSNVVNYFIDKDGSSSMFDDIFYIEVTKPTQIIFRPNGFFKTNLDSIEYVNHSFFKISKSRLDDTIIYEWSDGKGRFTETNIKL